MTRIVGSSLFAGQFGLKPIAFDDIPASYTGQIILVADDGEAPLQVCPDDTKPAIEVVVANFSQVGPFVLDDVLADIDPAEQLKVLGSVASNPARIERLMFRAGCVLRVGVSITPAATAGTLSVEVTHRGATETEHEATELIATLNPAVNSRFAMASSLRGEINFSEGDGIGVTVATSSDFAPSGSADITVEVLVLLKHADSVIEE